MWRCRRRRRWISENGSVTEAINASDVIERRSDGVCEEPKEMEGETVKNLDLGITENRRKEALERERERIVRE